MSKCAGCGKPLGLNEKICQGCGIRTPESNLGGEIHPSLKFVPPNPVNIPKAPVFHKKVEERKAVVIERLPPVKDNGLSFGKILALFVALAAVLAIAYFWFWLPKQTQDQATLNVPPVPPLAQAQIKSTNEVTQDPGVNSVDIRQEAKVAVTAITRDLPTNYVTSVGLIWAPIAAPLKNWANAVAQCATMNAVNILGYNAGWRPPTKDELNALYAAKVAGNMTLTDWTLYYTWSSTINDTGYHYVVNLSNGVVGSNIPTLSNVSCVHQNSAQ